jgi:hypothetical protein
MRSLMRLDHSDGQPVMLRHDSDPLALDGVSWSAQLLGSFGQHRVSGLTDWTWRARKQAFASY